MCHSIGNVYVADGANNRIQVFTSTGKFLRMFGSYGKGVGKLSWLCGIALDVQMWSMWCHFYQTLKMALHVYLIVHCDKYCRWDYISHVKL